MLSFADRLGLSINLIDMSLNLYLCARSSLRIPKYRWPDTDASRGILIFSQQMSEMLNALTYESYRVYSLCTVSRLHEALTVLDDVRLNRVNKLALDPVLAELVWSLGRDPVVSLISSAEIASFVKLVDAKQYALAELSAHIVLLLKLTEPTYKQKLEELLLEQFKQSKTRNAFRRTTAFYCSHLVNKGFSKTYIARVVDSHFFSKPIKRTGAPALKSFFRAFKEKAASHLVYTAVSKSFGEFLAHLGFSVTSFTSLPRSISDALGKLTDFPSVVVAERIAFDSYAAMDSINDTLTNVRALTYLAPSVMPCHWHSTMYVVRGRAATGNAETKSDITFERDRRPLSSGRLVKGIRNYSLRILNNFDGRSTERLLASINTGALARTSSSLENKLISLWSAVEVLLSEPQPGTPRIAHYTKLIIPSICLRYVRLLFASVCDELLISYRRKFKDIVFRETTLDGIDLHSRFAALLLMPAHEDLRSELLSLCRANPLALHRLYRLHNEFATPSSALTSINSHEKRVDWQVHRIYRARNNLVHAGRVPTYLDSLIVNLFEYYRSAVATIVNRARKEDQLSDIDQVVAEISIEYGIFKSIFQARGKATELTGDDMRRLISLGKS
jgi:hypothetical protein